LLDFAVALGKELDEKGANDLPWAILFGYLPDFAEWTDTELVGYAGKPFLPLNE
jgi:hypothetical protein